MSKGYKVIEIMNEKEVLINYGLDHGGKVGDEVRVYSIGEVVIDKDNNEVLGTLDIIKDELEVYLVYDKFSICRKLSRYDFNPILNPLVNLNKTRIESVDLNIDESDISGRKSPVDRPAIKVGDFVQIL